MKIGSIYETKEMNPPFYFSWEYAAGTYFPFLSPFAIAFLQIIFKVAKDYIKERKKVKMDWGLYIKFMYILILKK